MHASGVTAGARSLPGQSAIGGSCRRPRARVGLGLERAASHAREAVKSRWRGSSQTRLQWRRQWGRSKWRRRWGRSKGSGRPHGVESGRRKIVDVSAVGGTLEGLRAALRASGPHSAPDLLITQGPGWRAATAGMCNLARHPPRRRRPWPLMWRHSWRERIRRAPRRATASIASSLIAHPDTSSSVSPGAEACSVRRGGKATRLPGQRRRRGWACGLRPRHPRGWAGAGSAKGADRAFGRPLSPTGSRRWPDVKRASLPPDAPSPHSR